MPKKTFGKRGWKSEVVIMLGGGGGEKGFPVQWLSVSVSVSVKERGGLASSESLEDRAALRFLVDLESALCCKGCRL